MKDKKSFLHKKISPANPDNDRGKRTWEWKFLEGHQITVYHREEGESFAEHYHKGDDPAKNPERFLLIKGKMSATFVGPSGIPEEEIFDAVENPVEITIFPNIMHGMIALTNCCYVEYRPTYFNPAKSDTYNSAGEQQ